MKRAEIIFRCDLCLFDATMSGDVLPPGWVKLDIGHPDTDRTIAEKHICDECCLGIKKLHGKT